MGLKTLLVYLNDLRQCQSALKAAVRLAQHFGAHITGLYVISEVEIYLRAATQVPVQLERRRDYFRLAHDFGARISGPSAVPNIEGYSPASWGPVPVISESRRDYFQQRAEAVRSAFEDAGSKAGVGYEFRSENAQTPNLADAVIEHGRAVDLVIISDADKGKGSATDSDFVDRVLISTGRPTLVIPRRSEVEFSADSIIIAWNGSRGCACAAFDSIPLLERAKEVLIVCVGRGNEFSEASVRSGMKMAETLFHHGVKATFERLASSGEAGEALMMRAGDIGANMLVMGAYGHTRLHEFVLGGATRSVLSGMRCPVFFSH